MRKNTSFEQLINQKTKISEGLAGIAKAIEGQPRQTSIHAAGIVVMSDDDLTNYIPLKLVRI